MIQSRNCILFICFLLLTSCFASKKSGSSNSIIYKDFSNQPVSVVNIPVTVDLSSQFKNAEETLAKSYAGKEEPCEGLRYSYNFTRSPFQFNGIGDKINISFSGSYKMKMFYCAACAFDVCIVPVLSGSCGINEPERKLNIGYAMSYQITSDYRLLSTTYLTKLDAIDPCTITFVNYDITDRITSIVRNTLLDIGKNYDLETSKTNIKESLQYSWDTLSTPVKLDEGYGYFTFNPSSIAISPLNFTGSLLKFNAGITIKPNLQSEFKPPVYTKLPTLSKWQPSNGFNICTDVLLSYDSLTQLMNKLYMGQTITIKNRELKIKQIKIEGSDNNLLALIAEVSGSHKGTIRLSGHPYISQDGSFAGLAEPRIQLEKGSLFLKAGFWLFKKRINKSLAENSTFSITGFIDESRASVEKKLNQTFQQQYQLSGKVNQLKLTDVYASQNSLKLRTWTTGNLNLFFKL